MLLSHDAHVFGNTMLEWPLVYSSVTATASACARTVRLSGSAHSVQQVSYSAPADDIHSSFYPQTATRPGKHAKHGLSGGFLPTGSSGLPGPTPLELESVVLMMQSILLVEETLPLPIHVHTHGHHAHDESAYAWHMHAALCMSCAYSMSHAHTHSCLFIACT